MQNKLRNRLLASAATTAIILSTSLLDVQKAMIGSLGPLGLTITDLPDVRCALDNDYDGDLDTFCGEPDKDADGYGSTADAGLYTGTDCDDTDPHIFPTVVTESGCSTDQARLCNSDGSFSSCFDFSTAVATDFGSQYNGNLKWCDPTKTADTGSGTWASPLNCRAFVDSGMATYYDPGAGDVLAWQQTGSYSQTYTNDGTRVWYWNNQDGTSSHGILIWGANILAPNTGGTEVRMIDMTGSSYIVLMNTTLNGDGDNTGYSNAGIDATAIDYFTMINMNVFDVDGSGANNVSGIKIRGGNNYVERGTIAHDNYDRSNVSSVNNVMGTTVMDVDGWDIGPGVVWSTDGYGYCDKNKHGDNGSSQDNYFQLRACLNVGRSAIHWESGRVTAKYNFAYGYGQDDDGLNPWENSGYDSGTCEFADSVLEYNTSIGPSGGVKFQPDCPNGVGASALDAQNNVFVSTRDPDWNTNGDGGSDMTVCHYCGDTLYTATMTGGSFSSRKFRFDNNCWWNSEGNAFLGSIFGNNDNPPGGPSGNRYTSWAAWQAAGYDANSYNEDPQIGSDGIADSTNCIDRGFGAYFTGGSSTPTPTPTPSPTPSPTPTPVIGGEGVSRYKTTFLGGF